MTPVNPERALLVAVNKLFGLVAAGILDAQPVANALEVVIQNLMRETHKMSFEEFGKLEEFWNKYRLK